MALDYKSELVLSRMYYADSQFPTDEFKTQRKLNVCMAHVLSSKTLIFCGILNCIKVLFPVFEKINEIH